MILPRLKVVWAGDRRRDCIGVERRNISNGAWLNSEFRDRDILDLGVSHELELQNNYPRKRKDNPHSMSLSHLSE
jgi:hypothetical protein